MNRYSNLRAACAKRDHLLQPGVMAALLALALAFLLVCHGMARAENLNPPQSKTDQATTPIAAPPGSVCSGSGSDAMDFSPEENLPSPFDADAVAFRHSQMPRPGLYRAADDDCRNSVLRPQKT